MQSVAMRDDAPLWLFGDQLGPHFHSGPEHRHREIVLIESTSALTRRPCHRQKLHLVLSGMRHLADELGSRARIVRADTYRAALRELGTPVVVHEPGSHAAAALVNSMSDEGLVREVVPTAGFARSKDSFARWARAQRRFRMEDFYRDQRQKFDVLMEPGGSPAQGRWNFDSENRHRPPKNASDLGVPVPWHPREDSVDDQVRGDLDQWERDGALRAIGADGPRLFAVTRTEARAALRRFLHYRLPEFGPYQDAMLDADWSMAHALLSVPMNLGLLEPLEVTRAAEREYRSGKAPLSSVEGFIRQVLGWREYVWHLYWHFGPSYLRANELNATRPLPEWWKELDGDQLDAECLRVALNGVRDRGWAHHIQRLMVLGNHALQRDYRPAELTEWFATAFVDGFPWVMPVNVIGMSQHADGGRVATKPYASGGAYINRMSDSCRSCRFDPAQRVGEDACPFTAGYWAWMHRHEKQLRGNHRMRQPLATMRGLADLDAIDRQERGRHEF
ncbi:deoxyribodipyrimidine photolyase-related protein [Saccharopolyspora flava]|uniref:Deoxyribodipyrimidine photolyase-related protein n=1 Tax=Saccharopolyspora flava TaxID=95161 RepID=A0A1I6UEF2_9PSEU|nr:deoxyribodipyrimidine photolyase-related protein [Saccharopolyspora flava]